MVCRLYAIYGFTKVIIIMIITISSCRPTFENYGLWDQIRVDQGREWILSLYVQETLAHLRTNTSRAPHLQTSSKQV